MERAVKTVRETLDSFMIKGIPICEIEAMLIARNVNFLLSNNVYCIVVGNYNLIWLDYFDSKLTLHSLKTYYSISFGTLSMLHMVIWYKLPWFDFWFQKYDWNRINKYCYDV